MDSLTVRQQQYLKAKRRPCTKCGQPTGYVVTDSRGDSVVCRTCRPTPTQVVPPTTEWSCLWCGRECHRVPTRGSRPKYCNERCAAGATFARRRARLLAAFVEEVSPVDVFNADGYRCYLCRKMTDRTKTVPHKRAPTVDHVIPLSKGGLHERTNCRTACHSCNCAKQNRGGGEQLLLLAV